MSHGTASRGFRVTSRDLEIARWIGRLRMASAAQVADRFGVGRAVGYARLSGLVKLGLLEHLRIFHATPGAYTTTKTGLAAVDLNLPPARVDVRTYHHDLELSSLLIELERDFGRDRLRTEREMRSADTAVGRGPAKRPEFAVPLTGRSGQLQLTPVGHPRLHFPDCAVVCGEVGGSMLAVELERTAKGRPRLRQILSAYVAARHVSEVRYVIANIRVLDLVRSEVASARAEGLVTIQTRPERPGGVADRLGDYVANSKVAAG